MKLTPKAVDILKRTKKSVRKLAKQKEILEVLQKEISELSPEEELIISMRIHSYSLKKKIF